MDNKNNLTWLLPIFLLIGFLGYRYYTTQDSIRECYTIALLKSVGNVPADKFPDIRERGRLQDVEGERIFSTCLEHNKINSSKSFKGLRNSDFKAKILDPDKVPSY